MLKKIKYHLSLDTKIQVVGIALESDLKYSILHLVFKKNQLKIEQRFNFNSFDDLKDQLNQKHPVLLSFYGKGVINKKIKKIPDYKSKLIMGKNTDDFYFYEVHQTDKVSFISYSRKSVIDHQSKLFNDANFLVVDYSIGPFVSTVLQPFIAIEKIASYATLLHFDGVILNHYSPLEAPFSIPLDNDHLSAIEVPLFATATNYYFSSEIVQYDTAVLAKNRIEKKHKKQFELLGKIILCTFFFTLLTSYLLLGHFNDKRIEVNTSLSFLQKSTNELIKLQKERDEKRAILNQSGVFSTSYLSYYINDFVQELPATVSLNTFAIFPPKKKLRQKEPIVFKSQTITVKGVSTSNLAFNTWYSGLKKRTWIKKVDITDYSKLKSGNYNFILKIKVE